MKKRKQVIVSSTVLEFYEILVDEENTDYEGVIEEFYRIDSPEPYRTDSINWEVIGVDSFD